MAKHRAGIFSRGESEILEIVEKNLDHAIETAKILPQFIQALKDHNRVEVSRLIKAIGNRETEGDQLHVEAIEEVSKGSFFGGIREDLLTILENIDNIEDAAKDSSRIFSHRDISFEAIDYMFKRDVAAFFNKLLETDEELRVAVQALSKKDARTNVVELSTKVERAEEAADDLRLGILDNLLRNEIKADALDIIMLKEFLEVADNVADSAEDASDELLVLISKGYT